MNNKWKYQETLGNFIKVQPEVSNAKIMAISQLQNGKWQENGG